MKISELLDRRLSIEENAAFVSGFSVSKSQFSGLIACMLSKELRASQNAAWIASEIAITKPALFQPYTAEIVDLIVKPDVDEAVLRNGLRLLMAVSIPENSHGILMDRCFQLVSAPGTPPAIKANGLSILWNFCRQYPEIISELTFVIRELYSSESPAFQSRAKKIMKALGSEL